MAKESTERPQMSMAGKPRRSWEGDIMIIFDSHLDLAMNALLWNRDLKQGVYDIRRQLAGNS